MSVAGSSIGKAKESESTEKTDKIETESEKSIVEQNKSKINAVHKKVRIETENEIDSEEELEIEPLYSTVSEIITISEDDQC